MSDNRGIFIIVTRKFGPTVGQLDRKDWAKTIRENLVRLNCRLHTPRLSDNWAMLKNY